MAVSTFADGYGRWHAIVPDTAKALAWAVEAIAEQIALREDAPIKNAVQYVNENIVSIPDGSAEYGGYLHFAEYAID